MQRSTLPPTKFSGVDWRAPVGREAVRESAVMPDMKKDHTALNDVSHLNSHNEYLD
jgi:hypothetical protein